MVWFGLVVVLKMVFEVMIFFFGDIELVINWVKLYELCYVKCVLDVLG